MLLEVDPRSLLPNPWNPNEVNPENEEKLKSSIRRLGMVSVVVVRQLVDGTLQILGGQHRTQIAIELGIKKIPVFNLGLVDDAKAKEIGLVDNARYGADDMIKLAKLVEDLPSADELTSFLPFSNEEFDLISSSISVALDDLESIETDVPETTPEEKSKKPAKTHETLRFKVPIADADWVRNLVEGTMLSEGYTEEDALTNAGDALIHLLIQLRDHD